MASAGHEQSTATRGGEKIKDMGKVLGGINRAKHHKEGEKVRDIIMGKYWASTEHSYKRRGSQRHGQILGISRASYRRRTEGKRHWQVLAINRARIQEERNSETLASTGHQQSKLQQQERM